MKDTLNVGHRASVELVRPAKPASDKLEPHGLYHVEHWRDGKLLATYEAPNYITDEGRTALLGVMFHSVTQITSYWMGLVDSVSFTAYAQADAYGQLPGPTAGGRTPPTPTTSTAAVAPPVRSGLRVRSRSLPTWPRSPIRPLRSSTSRRRARSRASSSWAATAFARRRATTPAAAVQRSGPQPPLPAVTWPFKAATS